MPSCLSVYHHATTHPTAGAQCRCLSERVHASPPQTTMSNIKPRSARLVVHVITVYLVTGLVFYVSAAPPSCTAAKYGPDILFCFVTGLVFYASAAPPSCMAAK
jgi:hypothetical protein